MSFNVLSAILRGTWLIDPSFAKANLPLVNSLLSGGFEGFEYKADKNKEAYILSGVSAGVNTIHSSWSSINDQKVEEHSFAVIPVLGPIMKSDYCGDAGSMTRARQIREAANHPNIDAIILDIDSPGGMVDGTQTFADAINEVKQSKPVIGIINDGMAASAAYWYASQCTEVYVSQKTDMVGSIGVFLTLANFDKHFKEKGIEIHEIYAPESTEKNKDYKDAKNGDYKAIQSQLSFIAQSFIGAVNEGRGENLNLSKGDPFKGKMYFAEEAISIGLIDGIKSMDEVLERAAELSENQLSNSNNKNTTMSKKTYSAINAVLGVESLEASEEGTFLNEDQMDAVESGLNERNDMVSQEDHQATVDELATANDSLTAANDRLRTVAASVGVEVSDEDTDETIAANIEASFTALQGSSTEETTTVDVEGDEAADKDTDAVFASMSHNQEADNL